MYQRGGLFRTVGEAPAPDQRRPPSAVGRNETDTLRRAHRRKLKITRNRWHRRRRSGRRSSELVLKEELLDELDELDESDESD